MNAVNRLRYKLSSQPSGGLAAIFGGLLLGLPVAFWIPSPASAQINPCPGIYYETPFDRLTAAPQGCKPNAASQSASTEPASAQPALPNSQDSSTSVAPNTGGINITLTNQTRTTVIFRVLVGANQTASMGVMSGGSVTLHDLAAPVNVAFVRPDGGILQLNPKVVAPDTVEVTLSEAADNAIFAGGGLSIQRDGRIFLNQ